MRKLGGALALCVAVASMLPLARPAGAATTETLTATPSADTYVAADAAAKSFGTQPYMSVDASPKKTAFVRFNVAGVGARTVTNVRLRMYQTDNTSSGGRVLGMSSTTWPESTTWNT